MVLVQCWNLFAAISNSLRFVCCHLFGIGLNITFNLFQVIPGQCLLVTEGMNYDKPLYCCITQISLHAKFYDYYLYPTQSHYSGNKSTSFSIELHFICRALDKGATNLNSLVWLDRGSNPEPPRHGANAQPLLGYWCWMACCNFILIGAGLFAAISMKTMLILAFFLVRFLFGQY